MPYCLDSLGLLSNGLQAARAGVTAFGWPDSHLDVSFGRPRSSVTGTMSIQPRCFTLFGGVIFENEVKKTNVSIHQRAKRVDGFHQRRRIRRR
jgi:hypothetical protein